MKMIIRLTVAGWLLSAAVVSAQDSLEPIRDLYASAAYEEALSALSRLKAEAPLAANLEIDRYRVLCLMALNRGSEADRVIESIIAADPLYVPSTAEAAPRVRAAFTAVRQRMLPGIARTLYQDARAAYDRKAFAEAVKALENTVRVIDAVDGPAKAELSDLRTLSAGFLDLSRAALTPPPPQPAAPPVTPPVNGAAAASAAAKPVSPQTADAAPPLPDTALAVLKQEVPPLPFAIASLGIGEFRGIVEVQIDENGNVTSARILEPVHAVYDPVLLRAARDWKYQAPTIKGKPVSSLKRVEIVLRP